MRLQLFQLRNYATESGLKLPKLPKERTPNKNAGKAVDLSKLKGQMHLSSTKSAGFSKLDVDTPPVVAPLANNLDKVLFSPGVHFLKDPRTNVYNFPPELENIMSIKDFDFEKIPQFVPGSKDPRLTQLAKSNGKKYASSTSSMTGILTQLHRAISHQRPPHLMNLSKFFAGNTTSFSTSHAAPTLVNLKYDSETGVHVIQSDATKDDNTILSLLGHAMETMLVTETDQFAKYHRERSHTLDVEAPANAYNYMESEKFLLRSQLDCFDNRLPGTGMFDLKTRAACAVRHDIDYAQVMDGSDYQITQIDGYEESYNREFYDLIRTALFKYSLQARIGSMDGIFIAYHNIKTLFGFEYLPLGEIDAIFHTSHLIAAEGPQSSSLHSEMARVGPLIADREFALSLDVLGVVLDKILADNPTGSFNLAFHCTGEGTIKVLAKPMERKHLDTAQEYVAGEYPPGQDPFTLIQHYFDGNGNFPEDAIAYHLDIFSLINGKVIPRDEYPALNSEDDLWSLRYTFEPLNNPSRHFGKVMKQVFTSNNISSPITSRGPDEQEQKERYLAELPEPNKLQKTFRELDIKGARYKEWDNLREKLEWRPRTAV